MAASRIRTLESLTFGEKMLRKSSLARGQPEIVTRLSRVQELVYCEPIGRSRCYAATIKEPSRLAAREAISFFRAAQPPTDPAGLLAKAVK